jgi:uncharacterized protein (DUF433 family)
MTSDVINIDKDILGGTPVFRGTRVPVSILFDYLEDNKMDDFLENYPTVSKEQVAEVIKIASEIFSHKEFINENITR